MQNSNRRVIRVVKQNKSAAASRPQGSVDPATAARANHRAMTNAVDNWITERHANRRAEAAFSNGQLLGWRSASDENLEGE